ncbi:short chain dehydrogenase [Byssothecium circinans]|uniref:Short chain dehydrogenase n=1 Tax=Byssothecium circinans TaxID=147558 RepID=A0A6A5U220_9PLEO|nr:short chain dehydrogenase [Byssothecium circinans]
MADQAKYTTRLQNARILIIGFSSGLGYGVAEACLEHGAHVVGASSNPTRISAAISALQTAYPTKKSHIHGLRVDLSNIDTLEQELVKLFRAAVDKIGTEAGKLDHVIFTAGDALSTTKIQDLNINNIIKAGSVRFFAPLLAAKQVQKYLVASSRSSYTITTGSVSERPIPDWSVVASYAGGLHSMVRNLAVDLKPVRVNGISPGAVDTELWGKMGEEEKRVLFERLGRGLLVGRVGSVGDVVESYLAVLKDGFMDGVVVRSDGGGTIV